MNEYEVYVGSKGWNVHATSMRTAIFRAITLTNNKRKELRTPVGKRIDSLDKQLKRRGEEGLRIFIKFKKKEGKKE